MNKKTLIGEIYKVYAILYSILVSVVPLSILYIAHGYTCYVLWGWFVVPCFNVPKISISIAIGLCLTANAFFGERKAPKKSDKKGWEPFIEATMNPLCHDGLLLAVGFIIKQFL